MDISLPILWLVVCCLARSSAVFGRFLPFLFDIGFEIIEFTRPIEMGEDPSVLDKRDHITVFQGIKTLNKIVNICLDVSSIYYIISLSETLQNENFLGAVY